MELQATPETPEVESFTEDQAVSELMKRWGDDSPESDEAAESTDEQADQATADPEPEDDPQEEESGTEEVEVLGEKLKLSGADVDFAKRIAAKTKEFEAGVSRKFEEAATIRKAAEQSHAQAEQLNQFVHANAGVLADHKMVMNRLQAFENLDVASLHSTDPAMLARITAEQSQLMIVKSRLEQTYQQNLRQMNEAKGKLDSERLSGLERFAKANIKGWNDDYSKTLADFAERDLGFPREALPGIMSEPLIKALDLAYKGHKVQTSKPLDKRVTENKTLKPNGSGNSKGQAATKAEAVFAKAKKSGSINDAAMALLARSIIKRK